MARSLRPLYIFDLDGTLANCEHRLHLLEGDNPDKWRKFYAACSQDEPIMPVIRLMDGVIRSGGEAWIFTGRSDEVRAETVQWLDDWTLLYPHQMDTALVMRELGDHTPDHELKRGWYRNMLDCDRERLIAVFEDRQRVVDMWREEGVACFQAAPGSF